MKCIINYPLYKDSQQILNVKNIYIHTYIYFKVFASYNKGKSLLEKIIMTSI